MLRFLKKKVGTIFLEEKFVHVPIVILKRHIQHFIYEDWCSYLDYPAKTCAKIRCMTLYVQNLKHGYSSKSQQKTTKIHAIELHFVSIPCRAIILFEVEESRENFG